jgi:hypothetical protein
MPINLVLRKWNCLLIAALLLFFQSIHAQQGSAAIWLADSAQANIYSLYRAGIGGATRLYNGPEYTSAYPGTTGSQFFGSTFFSKGAVSYNGIRYFNVPIAFDLVSKEVVIKGHQGLSMQLQTENVDSFLIEGHSFVRLPDPVAEQMPEGFYEVLYFNSITVYIKRSRQVARSFNAEDPLRFISYDDFFILKDGVFYPVENKKSFLHLFHEDASALKKFWKTDHSDFKKEKEAAILNTIRFYVNKKY